MAIEFGTIPVRIRGVVYYTISGFEQRIWANFLKQTVPNMMRIAAESASHGTPAILLGLWTVTWSKKEYKRLNRKDPTLYENDK